MNAKSLTGTLSILGQAYVMMNDSARAKIIFEQVVKASPTSPDANAGLARLAQASKDYREASDLWTGSNRKPPNLTIFGTKRAITWH